MKSLYPRCEALDVHKETVVARARVQKGARVSRDVATFVTTTAGLSFRKDDGLVDAPGDGW